MIIILTVRKKRYNVKLGRIRFQASWSEQSEFDLTMTQFDRSNCGLAKLRRDVKFYLFIPWSLKTEPESVHELKSSILSKNPCLWEWAIMV